MATLTQIQAKLTEALTEVQTQHVKINAINTKADVMRQQIADLLSGAGIPDSLVAQVQQIIDAANLNEAALDETIAENTAAPPPPPPPPPPANVAPTITTTLTVLDETAPGSVRLTPTVSDTDGTIVKVETYRGATLIGTASVSPFTFTDSQLAAGTYTYTQKVFDDDGATATSQPVGVTIRPEDTTEPPIIVDPI
jgi:hypothetical protein